MQLRCWWWPRSRLGNFESGRYVVLKSLSEIKMYGIIFCEDLFLWNCTFYGSYFAETVIKMNTHVLKCDLGQLIGWTPNDCYISTENSVADVWGGIDSSIFLPRIWGIRKTNIREWYDMFVHKFVILFVCRNHFVCGRGTASFNKMSLWNLHQVVCLSLPQRHLVLYTDQIFTVIRCT